MKTAYYAHPVSLYGTQQEARDIESMRAAGFCVINPNDPDHEVKYKEQGMEYFREVIRHCNALFFRSFPNDTISSGVGMEIQWALDMDIPVFEVLTTPIDYRVLSVDETKAMLVELGVR